MAASLGPDLGGSGFKVYCRDGCAWAPVVDGALVRGRPLDLARGNEIRPNTPLIAGHNLNDGAGFVPTAGWGYLSTRSELLEYFARRFGPHKVPTLLEAFPDSLGVQPHTGVTRNFMRAQQCETDFSYACNSYWLAAESRAPAYVYQFSQVSPYTGASPAEPRLQRPYRTRRTSPDAGAPSPHTLHTLHTLHTSNTLQDCACTATSSSTFGAPATSPTTHRGASSAA